MKLRETQSVDLGLLAALTVLLEERSVTRAAVRLGRSVPAASRMLVRLRSALGDPLLVRAGRELVPTPRALRLAPRLTALIAEARTLVAETAFDPATLERRFTIRTSEDLLLLLAPALLRLKKAPHVSFRFAPEGEEDSASLRDGRIDLDIGVAGNLAGEIRCQVLARLAYAGVVRKGHPLLSAPITAKRFAAERHIASSRRGVAHGPIDKALAARGLQRRIVATAPDAAAAFTLAAQTDLVAAGVRLTAEAARRAGLPIVCFELPVKTPPVVIGQHWHPRFQDDPAHIWLRQAVAAALKAALANSYSAEKSSSL